MTSLHVLSRQPGHCLGLSCEDTEIACSSLDCPQPSSVLQILYTMKAAKEVRGWLGVQPPEPRSQLDLDLGEDAYVHKPLPPLEQNVLNAKMMLMTSSRPDQESL